MAKSNPFHAQRKVVKAATESVTYIKSCGNTLCVKIKSCNQASSNDLHFYILFTAAISKNPGDKTKTVLTKLINNVILTGQNLMVT